MPAKHAKRQQEHVGKYLAMRPYEKDSLKLYAEAPEKVNPDWGMLAGNARATFDTIVPAGQNSVSLEPEDEPAEVPPERNLRSATSKKTQENHASISRPIAWPV